MSSYILQLELKIRKYIYSIQSTKNQSKAFLFTIANIKRISSKFNVTSVEDSRDILILRVNFICYLFVETNL
jgi:hypothetical protein